MGLPLDRHHPRFARRDAQTERLFAKLLATTDTAIAESIAERIALLYLDLCSTMAGRYAGRGVDADDLEQVARLALVTAIARYRPGRGPSFAAYAVPTISGELKKHFRDRGWMVRPPRRVQELRADLAGERERVEQELGHTASDAELAGAANVTREEVREVGVATRNFHPVSLDCSPLDDEQPALAEQLACPDTALETADDRICLARALAQLDEVERKMLLMRYVDCCTQQEIASALGLSQMQVSRRMRRARSSLADRLRWPEHGEATAVAAS